MSEIVTNSTSTTKPEKQNVKLEKHLPQDGLRETDIESNVVLPSIDTKGNQKGKCIIFHVCPQIY